MMYPIGLNKKMRFGSLLVLLFVFSESKLIFSSQSTAVFLTLKYTIFKADAPVIYTYPFIISARLNLQYAAHESFFSHLPVSQRIPGVRFMASITRVCIASVDSLLTFCLCRRYSLRVLYRDPPILDKGRRTRHQNPGNFCLEVLCRWGGALFSLLVGIYSFQ